MKTYQVIECSVEGCPAELRIEHGVSIGPGEEGEKWVTVGDGLITQFTGRFIVPGRYALCPVHAVPVRDALKVLGLSGRLKA